MAGDERVVVHTVNNAWVAGEEAFKGKLAPGFLADVVVLDRHPLEVPVEELATIRVDLTLVGGRVVYSRKGLLFP